MDNLSPRKIQNIVDSRDRLKKRYEQSKDKYTKLEKEYELLKLENEQLKEKLEETTKLKDEFRQNWIETTAKLVRLVPRTKRGLDVRNSGGY